MLACSSPLLNVFSRLLPLISIFASHLLFAFLHDGFAAVATRWKFQNQGVSGRRESRLRNFLPRNWKQSALNGSPVWYEWLFLNWNNLWKFYIRILYPDIRILYPKLVCFGYHFLENFPFSLHYCYVKITIFHPMVSKIKLRFYLKPGNREYPYSSVGMRAAAIIMRVFKFHANSQGVKQTLEHKGYPRIRKPKENLYLFPLWLLCQMEGTFSCVSCLR